MKFLLWLLLLQLGTAVAGVAEGQRNLLLITVDTLRADYLSCNGSTRVRTPHLDRLAAAGVNFTRARAPVPLTLPSHASILTGNYPPTHTLRDNGSHPLPAAQETLAERLEGRGYRTAAFVGSFVLDRRFGLEQGFDLYDDRTWSDLSMLERVDAERPAEQVLAAFRPWLAGLTDGEPFFAWIHLFDPHAPYTPPEPFKSRYPEDPYAGEVAYTDEIVGRIVAELESRGLFARTVVAMVADHGEGLGDHREKTHGILIYNSTLHVPMLLSVPGLIRPGTTVDGLVRTIDLAPTLLDYLGDSAGLGEGASLRGLIEGAGGEEPRSSTRLHAYSESLYARMHLGWSELSGLEVEGYRIILAPEPELYDLRADTGETVNLAASRRDRFRELSGRLEELRAGFPSVGQAGDSGSLDPQVEARLRSLGYLGGSRASRVTPSADPKTKMETWDRIQLALAQFALGDLGAAVATLEKLLETERDIPLLYEYLGTSYLRLEQWEKAERINRQALSRGIESASLRAEMGLLALRRGEPERAKRELEAALQADGLNVAAHHRLGDLYRGARRYEEAVEHYRRAVAINPDYVYSWNGMAMALAAANRNEEALAAFREAVRIDPEAPLARFNLAVQLERMDRPGAARSEYEHFLRLSDGERGLDRERQRAAEAARRLGSLDSSEPRELETTSTSGSSCGRG
jgi:arylsulfatase A-like enzyme/Tfp pilus assembly protein PilF